MWRTGGDPGPQGSCLNGQKLVVLNSPFLARRKQYIPQCSTLQMADYLLNIRFTFKYLRQTAFRCKNK